jgi:hypothetical protein
MSIQMRPIEVKGLKETIRELNKVQPGLRKEFVSDVRRISAPALQSVKQGYAELPLSGMSRKWADSRNGRQLFPFTIASARRGVRPSVNTDPRSNAVISIVQYDVAASIFETAGRANPNPLGRQLGFLPSDRTRVVGPKVEQARPQIEDGLRRAIEKALARTNRKLAVR